MNFGARNRHISSDAVPAIRTRPEIDPVVDAATGSRAAGAHATPASSARHTTSRPTPREALTSTTSPGASSSGSSAAAASASATGSPPPSKRSAIAAASGPTVTSTSTPASSAVRADLVVEPALVGTELEHVAEHRDARRCRRGRCRGEVVERGAHRHRVGVVAVVDQRARRRAAPPAARARRELELDAAAGDARRSRARRRPRRAGCGADAPA